MQFYFQDTGVQKCFGWILAGIPGLPTVPVLYHGKTPTQQQAVNVKLPSPGKLSMSCFNVRSSWAASPEGFSMQGEAGIKHTIPPKGRNSLSEKSRAEIEDCWTSPMYAAFPGMNPTLPAGHLHLTRILLTASADELWINFRKCLASELVTYLSVMSYQEVSVFPPQRYDCAELIKPKQLRSLSEQSGAEITIVVKSLNGSAPGPPGSPGPSLLLLLYSLISVLLKK